MKDRFRSLYWTVLVALPLILYAPFLFGGKVLYWGVYLLQFYPWRQLAVEQIRAGRWPLWNPYLGAGTPLAANLQSAVFYPLNAIFLLMPVERAFGWALALHVALAGLFAYYLGRTLGMRRFGALISGLAYGGGGYLVARWVFPSMVYAAAWLPLMMALTEKLIRHATSNVQRGIGVAELMARSALLALVIALQLLAGHAQTSFYSTVIVAAFAVVRLIQQFAAQRERQDLGRSVLAAGCMILATLWGLALAAIQLLPTAELAANSQRAGTLTDLQFAYELSFWPWRLITLLAPDFFGNPGRNEYWAFGTYWEEAAFVGILPWMLALVAFGRWRRQRRDPDRGSLAMVPFLSVLSVLSFILAMGGHTPLYPLLFRYVPGFGLFQAPARLMIGYALGVSLLAGIGADNLSLGSRSRTGLRIAVLVGLGTGIAGVFARLALPGIRASFGDSMIRLSVTLTLAAALLLVQGRRLRGGRWQALAIVLVSADLLAFGLGLVPGTDLTVYRAPVVTAEFLQAQPPGRVMLITAYAQRTYDQYVSLNAFGSSEPDYLQGLRESFLPNLSAAHHLPAVGNYDPLTIGPYRDLWEQIKGAEDAPPGFDEVQPLLNLLGGRYVISDEDLPLPRIYDAGPTIYCNDAALPEAIVVPQAQVVADPSARMELLQDPDFDPLVEVLLSQAPSPPVLSGSQDGGQGGTATVSRPGPDQVRIEVDMERAGYLVLADTYYPGWRARVDGQPAEILQANHAFRAVALDAGQHLVVFEYDPLSFRLGAWITVGAALLLAAVLVVGWSQRGAT